MIKDPMCAMEVNPQHAIHVQYRGKIYYFCSPLCKSVFEREPEKHLKSEEVKADQTVP